MNEKQPQRMLRSIGAVLAGLLAVIILSIGTDAALHATGVFPPWGRPMPDGLFMLATFYRTVYGIVGGYIAARLAPYRPIAHALALGVVGFVVSLAGVVATWNAGPEFGPKWYPLALVAIAMPSAWLGGRLLGTKLRARADGDKEKKPGRNGGT